MNVCSKVDFHHEISGSQIIARRHPDISDFYRSRIHERTNFLSFLGIILRVLRHITNQF